MGRGTVEGEGVGEGRDEDDDRSRLARGGGK